MTANLPANVQPAGAVAPLNAEVATMIRQAAPQFAPFLPRDYDVEAVVAAVYLETQRVPQILNCTPESIVQAACRLVQGGYEIGRTGFLVPFKGKATDVPHYRGLIEVVTASGAARSCEAREVRDNDFFEWEYGTNGFLKHVPGAKAPRRTGFVTHFYALWYIGRGQYKWDVMTIDDVRPIHAKSQQWSKTPLEKIPWYGIKTVVRRSSKQFAQNPKLAKFFAQQRAEEDREFGETVLMRDAAEDGARLLPMPPDETPLPPEEPAHAMPTAVGDEEEEEKQDQDVVAAPTLSAAMAFVMPGQPPQWGGFAGKRFADCRNNVLMAAEKWATEQLDKPNGYARAAELVANAKVVLEARRAGTIQQPGKVEAA